MPRLELLKLSKINSEKLWDDKPLHHSCIQNVKSLTIDECGKVAYAFSSSVAKGLENLTHLKISNCQMLEIFFSDGKSSSSVSNDQVSSVSNTLTIYYFLFSFCSAACAINC